MPHANSTYALTAKWRHAGGEQHERRLGPLDAASSCRRGWARLAVEGASGIETGDVDLPHATSAAGESDLSARACGKDDAVVSFPCERAKERVAVAAAMADAGTDAFAEVSRTPLEAGQRFRHLVTGRRVHRQMRWDPLQTSGDERGVLGPGHP